MRCATLLLVCVCLGNVHHAVANEGATEAATDLPIEVQELSGADCLRCVHLYDLRKENVPEGGGLSFLAECDADGKLFLFRDPPWIHVTWADRGVQQAFRVCPDRMPKGAKPGAVFRLRGRVSRNRPDLDYHAKQKQKIHHFNVKVLEAKPIGVNITPEESRKRFAQSLGLGEARLRKICADHGLTYVPPKSGSGNVSWYRGKIAVTDVASNKPRYSRAPVPYATASVLIDPATGKAVRLIVQRRIHQDPHD